MSEVLLEVDAGVAVLTLNAPTRFNALTVAMADELVAALAAVEADPSVAALVVRGEGKAFCAGGDVATLADAGVDPADPERYAGIGAIYASFTRLGKVGVPTIAAVHGAVVGAGMNLMLAADLRVVAQDARLICGFLKRGLHPGGGHFLLLERLAGREAAAAMGLFGEEVDGTTAQRLGLAWDAVPAAEVTERALELARRVAGDPELARAVVTTFRRELGPPHVSWDVAVQVERPSQMWSMRRAEIASRRSADA
ncbi:enoyl-CoA hydratase-related protein [Pimelobacter simplex]|uniref:enoyl-CoA hydratase-related protein n=1 Tax=Nocardioides simplex TaxID=2045 RepID=UPI00215022DD|nr:enoyl-CoA hydratase-related protein [Pimelobacter simplex]UUW91455.1 enoyl-CoA hydratase-related protein [Pimelobacter simplex]UUW95283.1 enoyl-CoA hydratase-related protein [Pimelobacter simplex]